MSTYKARKNAAQRFGISPNKLLATSALTAAGLLALGVGQANAGDGPVGANDVIILENTAPDVLETGYSEYSSSDILIDNAIQEDVGVDGHTHFNSHMTVITGVESGQTKWYGKVTASGDLLWYDVDGILFGETSRVDVVGNASFTGGSLTDMSFNGGDAQFKADVAEGAEIVIEDGAMISVGEAGLAAFVAPHISNSGIISAKMGTVALAAGQTVTLDLYGDGLVEVAVEGELADALIENKGTIAAEGGRVQMTALAAKDAVDNIINTSGIVTVASATQQGGKIILSGGSKGKVAVSGTLDATGTTGGDIEVTGEYVSADSGALIDASGTNGGGAIRFGGDYQGEGDTPTSDYAYVDQNAIFRSDAIEEGDGGSVIVWADQNTGYYGHISATGGANGGDGGFVETSAEGYLEALGTVDASAANGAGGEWLLDPRNLTVTTFDNRSQSFFQGGVRIIQPTSSSSNGNTSYVNVANINASLNIGTSVTLRTRSHDSGDGDININAEINKTSGGNATFRAEAHDDIFQNQDIISTAGQLNVELIAGAFGNRSGTQLVKVDNDIETNGGHFLAYGEAFEIDDSGDSIDTTGSAGNVTIIADSYDIDGTINAGDALVTFRRKTDGNISLGDNNGGARLSQSELERIDAGSLRVGGNNTSAINVDNVDTTSSTITGLVTLITGSNLTGSGDDITFAGSNTFNSLSASSNDDIVFETGAKVETLAGDATFLGDSNGGTVGDFDMGENALIDTNGNKVSVSSLNVRMQDDARIRTEGGDVHIIARDDFASGDGTVTIEEDAFIDADGGDILIENEGVFSSELADSLRTHTDGTIELNQWVGGSIQNAIDAVENTGSGTNTVNIGPGTFNEALSIYEDNFVLIGDGTTATTTLDGTGIGGNGITISANNTSLNGMIIENWNRAVTFLAGSFMDLAMNDILARNNTTGLFIGDSTSLDGLDVDDSHFDNNTFGWYFSKNNPTFPNTTTVTNVDVDDTTFSGNTRKGIYVEKLDNASFTNVDVIGSGVDGTYTNNSGVDINLKNGTYANIAFDNLTVSGSGLNGAGRGTAVIIKARNDGASYSPFPASLTNVTITNSNITAGSDVALSLGNNINGGSVTNSTISGPEAVTLYGGVTNVTIGGDSATQGNTITATGASVTNPFFPNFGVGIFTSDGNTVAGNDIDADGVGVLVFGSDNTTIGGASANLGNDIDSVSHGVFIVDGIDAGTTLISHNDINSTAGDGVHVGSASPSVSNGATLEITNNVILGALDGVHIADKVDNATVKINDNVSITGTSDDGVDFNKDIVNGSTVEVNGNDLIVGGSSNGIEFASVQGGSTVDIIGNNDGIHADDNGIFFTTVGGGSTVNIHDNIIKANLDNRIFGSGIWFNRDITDANINIGDGALTGDPSNFITVAMNLDTNDQSDLDGVHFEGAVGNNAVIKIDGNRMGYTGTPGNQTPVTEVPLADDGVEFKGAVSGNADIKITDNHISAKDDGVQFSSSVGGTAKVNIGGTHNAIDGNKIKAGDHGLSFLGAVTGQAIVEIVDNEVTAGNDGAHFGGAVNNAVNPGTNEQEIYIEGNTIDADNNGINFTELVSNGRHDQLIKGNTITADNNGVSYAKDIDDAHVRIIDGNDITGGNDAVRIGDDLQNSARLDVNNNTNLTGTSGDGIDIDDDVKGGSTLNVIGNDNITAGNNGVEISDEVKEGSTVTISGNNHGIHADDNGIFFGGNIFGGSTINIHDNIITANEDSDAVGSGIWFGGTVKHATVNIGDGGSSFRSGASNIISVRGNNGGGGVSNLDGIHFDKEVGQGADINIDGNRIGYYASSVGGWLYTYRHGWDRRIADDGIEFKGNISGNADIDITDNFIRAKDDGIQFSGKIKDNANILIGGRPSHYNSDGNTISAWDDGISFLDEVKDHSLVEISYNSIYGGDDGIYFKKDTSNHRHNGNPEEILIKKNWITGGDNGINFEGKAKHGLHDIMIRDNYRIKGERGDGIRHTGGIRDAELTIEHNDKIDGKKDGIHIVGRFQDDAGIRIHGNKDVRGRDDDGIHVQDTGNDEGVDLEIDYNHVHWSGEDGIFVKNIEDANIHHNTVHNVGRHGIYGSNVDNADIVGNTIFLVGGNGVLVNPSDYTYIAHNNITGVGGNGIFVDGGTGHYIYDNTIRIAGWDGIRVEGFGTAWIAYNDIKWTGDDGIHAEDGNFVSIYGNYIDLSGYKPVFNWRGHHLYNIEVGDDANGIYVQGVGGGDSIPVWNPQPGPGFSIYGADVEIYGNDVANSEDDGIQVERYDDDELRIATRNGGDEHYSTYIGHNVVGHVGDDGVDVDDYDVTLVKENVITLAEDKGITIDGGRYGDYAGVFNNRILLTGNDGIQVENIRYDLDDDTETARATLGDDEHGYGWAVNVSGNQIAMTGDDGIEVRYSDATKVARNQIFMAGMGYDGNLRNVIETVNDFANETFDPRRAGRSFTVPSYDYFNWRWGDGHGINVHGIDGAYYSPNGWAVDVKNNWIKWTGGHGILAENNDRTRIKNNDIYYSGIDETKFYGVYSMLELIDSGPFDGEGRRDLWKSEGKNMIDVLESYIGGEDPEEEPEYGRYVTVKQAYFDNHDGIHAYNIYGQSEEGLSRSNYLFDLKIVDNDVYISGDDNIAALYSGRTMIRDNVLRDAGVSSFYYGDLNYNGGDLYGGDNIFAKGIEADLYPSRRIRPITQNEDGSWNYEPRRNYALIIKGNDARRAADDNIEVVGRGSIGKFGVQGISGQCDEDCGGDDGYGVTDRVLIAENRLRDAGYESDQDYKNEAPPEWDGPSTGDDGYGHDNIHVRGIFGNRYSNPDDKKGPGNAGNAGRGEGFYGYAVDIIDNNARRAADDNIEVIESTSTLILDNRLRDAGYGSGRYYYRYDDGGYYYYYTGADRYGADNIHVRNVGGNYKGQATDGNYSGDLFEPYAVVIAENNARRAQDDNIEVVGEGKYIYEYGRYFGGTGRTLIENNFVRRAGKGGNYFWDYYYGDGNGADNIHVRGVQNVFKLKKEEPPVDDILTTSISGGPYGYGGYDVQIIGNDAKNAKDDNVEVIANRYGDTNILVERNELRNARDTGIHILAQGPRYNDKDEQVSRVTLVGPGYGEVNSDIFDNNVTNARRKGLHIDGYGHGDVVLEGNTFLNNPVGARFESGRIDVTGRTNNFIVTPDYELPRRFDYVTGMQFELAGIGDPTILTIVDETLGTTRFSGFINRPVGEAFYVRFEDGAILDSEGNVIVIDGTNANWDGVVPANFGNVLPANVLQAIEDRLFDADDPLLNGRGQIFVGTAQQSIDNVEDFFNQFDPFGAGLSGLNLTITGLPPVNLGQQALGGIQPFAGNPADIEPAAGGEGTEVANIEPAAGGSEAACWAQVFEGIISGSVNYGFTDDPTAALQSTAEGC